MDASILSATSSEVSAAISALASCEAEIKRLVELREQQTAKEAALQDELTLLESGMGEKILAAIEAGKDVSKAVAVEVESKRLAVEMARAVSFALIPKMAGAQKAALRAKAEVLRAEADRLTLAVDQRQAITDAFLSELYEFEGCAFAPAVDAEQMAFRAAYGDPRPPQNTQPLTRLLLNRVGGLRSIANAIASGAPMPADLITGQLIVNFEIDFAGGRVLAPEI